MTAIGPKTALLGIICSLRPKIENAVWAICLRTVLTVFLIALIEPLAASAAQPSDISVVAEASGEAGLAPSIAKWPTRESCATPNSTYRLEPRWQSFTSRGDLWVCFYRILSSLETKSEMRQWLSQFDMQLIEDKGVGGQNVLVFSCSKTNKKCKINWNSVDVVFPIFLKPYSFSFGFYERGGEISRFFVSANRE